MGKGVRPDRVWRDAVEGRKAEVVHLTLKRDFEMSIEPTIPNRILTTGGVAFALDH